jgi:SHS2 domain-containing protein
LDQNWEIFEHTADVGIRAHGTDQAEAFANAATAMCSLITDLEYVKEDLVKEVKVGAPDRELLLVEWLNQLVYLFDTEYILIKRVEISHISDIELEARCFGERVDKSRHMLKTAIKSATYHMLKVEENLGFKVQVVLDV